MTSQQRKRGARCKGNRDISACFLCLCPFVFLVTTQAGAQTIDNPLPLALGVASKVTLGDNEQSYFQISLPATDIRVVLDTRRTDGKNGNLISTLAVLNRDGGVIQDHAISFNQIDVAYRSVTYFSLKQPKTVGFKLVNLNSRADFWLTVMKKSDGPVVPFFGEIVPALILLTQANSGRLDDNEDAYYVAVLPKGDYTAILDFSNAAGQNTNIQGYLGFLEPDGGGQQVMIGLNEVNVSYRKTAGFSLKKDQAVILRVHNFLYSVHYTVKLAPGLPE